MRSDEVSGKISFGNTKTETDAPNGNSPERTENYGNHANAETKLPERALNGFNAGNADAVSARYASETDYEAGKLSPPAGRGNADEYSLKSNGMISVRNLDAITRLKNKGRSGFADAGAGYLYKRADLRTDSPANSAEKADQPSVYVDGRQNTVVSAGQSSSEVNLDVYGEQNTESGAFIPKPHEETAEGTLSEDVFGGVFSGRPAGQLFSTYLIVERGDTAYFIDQHAAHERVIFDELTENLKEGLIQNMLVPFVREFGFAEFDFLCGLLTDLRACGFDIEEFGDRTLKISAVPLALTDINFNRFFDGLLTDTAAYRSVKFKDILKDKLASAACRAAVKGGDTLTPSQTDALLREFDAAGTPPLSCPHGRPSVLKLTKRELEKMFKRIV
jgi:DNA mismatch repair ATPase MutL